MREQAVFAPGRVNLIGEHTDYTGGLVLPVAIDRGTTVRWRRRDRSVRVRSVAFGTVVEISADGNTPPVELDGWGRYLAAVVHLLRERGRPSAGIDGIVTSTLPIGSGLSSSAALTVALSLALCRAASFEIEPLELAHLAQESERLATGVSVGLMDPACILLASRGHALLLDCATEEFRHVPLPPQVALVVVDSGVRRTLGGVGYSERRREVERGDPRRVRHIASENERVRRAVAALDRGDVAALGPIFREGHDSLRDDFEVSTPELDLLVDLAYEQGALAARMTGGGFGGAVVVLADKTVAEALAGAIVGEYRRRTGRDARSFACDSASGAASAGNRVVYRPP